MNENFLKKIDWYLIIPAAFLSAIGIFSIYVSSIYLSDFTDFKEQIIFFLIGIALFFILIFFNLSFLKTNSYLVFSLYLISILLLSGLYIFGERIRHVKGWYKFGTWSFDPVPFSAIILIIVLAKYFSTRHEKLRNFQLVLFSGLYALIPTILVFFQPDLGSSLTLVFVWLGVIIASGVRIRHLIIIFLVFLLIFVSGWAFWMKDYQKQRIISFVNPQIDKQGFSWNINQSKIAIGNGGLFGKWLKGASQTRFGFLPESKTDFIFSSIAEETGFLGLSFFFSAFLFLLLRIIKIAFLAKNNFIKLFSMGFAFLILSQSFINIAMCLGVFPVVGIPLPFVSYGGSQLLAFYFGLGILNNISRLDKIFKKDNI